MRSTLRRLRADVEAVKVALAARSAPPEASIFPDYATWLGKVSPELAWGWPHLEHIRDQLADVTAGRCKKLLIALPPQHGKTHAITVRYPLWRMLRTPGLRAGVGTYNQRYANKVSRWTRRIVTAQNVGYGASAAVDTWELANGSSYIARGAGVGLAGEPVELFVCDDPFKNREEASSPVEQENVWEWWMDDVTPRVQQGGAAIVVHTIWGPGDLINRILASEDGPNWRLVRLPAVAESQEERDRANERLRQPAGLPDPLGRAPGEALCPARFNSESLEDKRRVLGAGFESLYQQNPVARGGTFFERNWFTVLERPPTTPGRLLRYWDLASSREDSACYTSGVLMGKHGDEFVVHDVIRGRWGPADRNDIMLQTATADETRPGYERAWFEQPIFDKKGSARRGIMAKMAGHRCSPDPVSGSGSKEIRAEPLADAAKAGLVKLLAAPWTAAYLTEMETFPAGTYKDQVDSSTGCFNKLSRAGLAMA